MKIGTREIVIALALGALLWGGTVYYSKKQIADKLWVAFEAAGYPGEWGIALGTVESNLRVDAINKAGRDGERGGAFGVTQITEQTARAYGYTGPMEALLSDLPLAINLTLRIVKAGNPKTLEDLGAWWNAGHRTEAALIAAHGSNHQTVTTYIPALLDAYKEIA